MLKSVQDVLCDLCMQGRNSDLLDVLQSIRTDRPEDLWPETPTSNVGVSMDKIEWQECEQKLEELLEVMSQLREEHPDIFEYYMDRLLKIHIRELGELDPEPPSYMSAC